MAGRELEHPGIGARRHEPEIRECANEDCQRKFDLARQDYYGPECPVCHTEEADAGA